MESGKRFEIKGFGAESIPQSGAKAMPVSEYREESLAVRIGPDQAGQRLDQALAQLFPDFSRSRLQEWIRDGRVQLDGRACRPRDKVLGGEQVRIRASFAQQGVCRAQEIPLELVYADDAVLVINKPAGLVMHPAAGNPDGTLQNALLHFDPTLAELPRAGIIHRLDKDTSGLLVVTRTPGAHRFLVEELQQRRVKREYRAIVNGVMTGGGSLDRPVGRHPVHRTRMAVVEDGKPALTRYWVLERFRGHTYVKLQLETGRTHQIRVHMAYLHYPLVGDPLYGGRLRLPAGAGLTLQQALRGFKRQALHARRLGFVHPLTREWVEWSVPLPDDMQQLLQVLREDAGRPIGA
jgi:23S rRNA pseudouridine1911/1915/1917 synthase